jgi:hypothetical protein
MTNDKWKMENDLSSRPTTGDRRPTTGDRRLRSH